MDNQETDQVLNAIRRGELDDQLGILRDAISNRRQVVGEQKFRDLRIGDEVTFSDQVGSGLGGTAGVVTGKLRKNVQVKSSVTGQVWRVSPRLLVFD